MPWIKLGLQMSRASSERLRCIDVGPLSVGKQQYAFKVVNHKIIPLRLPASIRHVAFITELIWNMLSGSPDTSGDTMAWLTAEQRQ